MTQQRADLHGVKPFIKTVAVDQRHIVIEDCPKLIGIVIFGEFSCLFRLRRNSLRADTVQYTKTHGADRAEQRQHSDRTKRLQAGIGKTHGAKY